MSAAQGITRAQLLIAGLALAAPAVSAQAGPILYASQDPRIAEVRQGVAPGSQESQRIERAFVGDWIYRHEIAQATVGFRWTSVRIQAEGRKVAWFDATDAQPWALPPGAALACIDRCDRLDAGAQHAAFSLFVEAASQGVQMAAAGGHLPASPLTGQRAAQTGPPPVLRTGRGARPGDGGRHLTPRPRSAGPPPSPGRGGA